MLPNNDRISKASKGYAFPITTTEIVNEMRKYDFKVPTYHERLPVIFQNNPVDTVHGWHLMTFCPYQYITLCAIAQDQHTDAARNLIHKVIEKFAQFDASLTAKISEHQLLIYRAYISSFLKLVFTKCIIHVGPRKYLWYREYSKVVKSKKINQQEDVIEEISRCG